MLACGHTRVPAILADQALGGNVTLSALKRLRTVFATQVQHERAVGARDRTVRPRAERRRVRLFSRCFRARPATRRFSRSRTPRTTVRRRHRRSTGLSSEVVEYVPHVAGVVSRARASSAAEPLRTGRS